MTQNIYGLTRNTRPRGVHFILSGSKRFRKNGGPHLKGSRRPPKKVARPLLLRRPKVVFFGAQAGKKRFLFFFSAPSRYGVRRPNNFFDPPPKSFGPHKLFSAPNFVFLAAFLFFWRPKPIIVFFGGRLRSNIFRRPSGKTSFFFFFFGAASLWCSAAK